MERKKKNILISVVIIAVLGGYLFFASRHGASDIPDLPDWEGSSDEIVIKRPSSAITLVRKEGKWLVNTEAYPADNTAVQGIEKTMRELAIADLVSEKGLYGTYDLTPDKYTEVTVRKEGKAVRRVMFGKKSPASQHTFIMIDGDKGVYMARGTFDSLLDTAVDDLRDKVIVKVNRGDVLGLQIACKGKAYAFVREAPKSVETKGKDAKKKDEKAVPARWIYKGNEAVELSAPKMNALAMALDPLKATGFTQATKESLGAALSTITVKTAQKEVTVRFFKKGADYFAVSSETPYVYSISQWTAMKFIFESIQDFTVPKD